MNISREWQSLSKESKELIQSYQEMFPVKVGALAKSMGIQVKSASLPAGISGEIKEIDGQVIVRVNRHDVKARQRFTIAHEIAHFLLHRHLIGDGITDDILYRSSLSDALEAQANRLAADIIMPWHLIKESLEELRGQRLEEKIETIAKQVEVSTTAIKIRLGKI